MERIYIRLGDGFNIETEPLSLAELLICNQRVTMHFNNILCCRPQTQGEEELQLQLALAMSREEAEAEDTKKKSDDMRLQMAIAKSKDEASEVWVHINLT